MKEGFGLAAHASETDRGQKIDNDFLMKRHIKKLSIIISKYNVVPRFVVYDRILKKRLDCIAKSLWFLSFLLLLADLSQLINFSYRNFVSVTIFLLMSISSAIYFSPYKYHNQYYAICKTCGEKIPIRRTLPPEIISLGCKNRHSHSYKLEELKSYQIGVAFGPEEKAYKSFRFYKN